MRGLLKIYPCSSSMGPTEGRFLRGSERPHCCGVLKVCVPLSHRCRHLIELMKQGGRAVCPGLALVQFLHTFPFSRVAGYRKEHRPCPVLNLTCLWVWPFFIGCSVKSPVLWGGQKHPFGSS